MEQDSHVGDPHGALDIVEMMNAVVREQNEYGSWAAKEICDRYSLLSTKCSDLQAVLAAKDARIRELEQRLDAVLPDAVWAMQHVHHDMMPGTAPWHRAAAFLTTDLVKDYRTRQEQKK